MPFISSVRSSYGSQGRFNTRLRIGAGTTGGTITTAGGFRIHTFSSAGTFSFTPDGPGQIEFFMIGGGGSGGDGYSGGAGAGGAVYSASSTINAQTYSVVVGNGAAGAFAEGPYIDGVNGGNTTFLGYTASGGGSGAAYSFSPGNGGCGGGSHGAGSTGEASSQVQSSSTQSSYSGLTTYGTIGGKGTETNSY
jgi:hypothetical protein